MKCVVLSEGLLKEIQQVFERPKTTKTNSEYNELSVEYGLKEILEHVLGTCSVAKILFFILLFIIFEYEVKTSTNLAPSVMSKTTSRKTHFSSCLNRK